MPNQEFCPVRPHKEVVATPVISYYSSLGDLQQQTDTYRSLLDLYVNAFNPVFDETWTPESVDNLLARELSMDGTTKTIAVLSEDSDVLGFYCGVSGDTSKMIPFCAETYLAGEVPLSAIFDISKMCLDKINNNYGRPELLHVLFELAVKSGIPKKTGHFLRSVFSHLDNSDNVPAIGFGMTSLNSPFYEIARNRGVETILNLSEAVITVLPEDKRLFIGGYMSSLAGGRNNS